MNGEKPRENFEEENLERENFEDEQLIEELTQEQVEMSEDFVELKRERMKKVVSLFEVGLDSKDGIGYHGTSLEAIEFLIKNGYIPGRFYNHKAVKDEGKYIYFYPKKSKFPDNPSVEKFYQEKDLLRETRGYAESVAQRHYFIKQLGLDISDEEIDINASRLFGHLVYDADYRERQDSINFFKNLGIKEEDLNNAIERVKKRKGIVIDLNKSILSSHSLSVGDGLEELKILIPEGLSLDFLSGIKPLGEEEFNYFEKIQKDST